MIVRSEAQTTVNDLAVMTRDLADRYQDAQEMTERETIRELFRERAAHHAAAAERLSELVRRLGDLPDLPDADWESVERIWMAVRSHGGGEHALLHTLAERERHLARHAEQARRLVSQGAEVGLWLKDLGERAGATADRLDLLGGGD